MALTLNKSYRWKFAYNITKKNFQETLPDHNKYSTFYMNPNNSYPTWYNSYLPIYVIPCRCQPLHGVAWHFWELANQKLKGKIFECFREKNVSKLLVYHTKSWKRVFWKGKNIICLHCAAFGRDRMHCRRVPRSDSVSRVWWCSSYSCCNSSPPAGSWTETE
jgi:hypothetical protein